MSRTRRLTPQHEKFCLEFVFTGNGAESARRAEVSPGMARKRACEWLQWPEILKRIADLRAERDERLKLDQAETVKRWKEMASVDINEMVEHRRVNCRHCHGVNHEYQWTPAEFRAAQRKYDRLGDAAKNREAPPDDIGGLNYDRTRKPNPDCPECRGEGVGEIFFKDSRSLSPAARRLYEGAQIGRDGKKMLFIDKAKLEEMIGRAEGVFKDKVEHSGNLDMTINFDRADSEA